MLPRSQSQHHLSTLPSECSCQYPTTTTRARRFDIAPNVKLAHEVGQLLSAGLKFPGPRKSSPISACSLSHHPIRLDPNLRQPTPPLQIPRVALITMRIPRLLPMALGEPRHGGDPHPRNIVFEKTHRPHLFQPSDTVRRAGCDALVLCPLEIDASFHWPAVDGVVDAVFVLEPRLVPPFRTVVVLVLCGIVIDQMAVRKSVLKVEPPRDGYTGIPGGRLV